MLKPTDREPFFATDRELKAAMAAVKLIFRSIKDNGDNMIVSKEEKRHPQKGVKYNERLYSDAVCDYFLGMNEPDFDELLWNGYGIPILWVEDDGKGTAKRYYAPTKKQLENARNRAYTLR